MAFVTKTSAKVYFDQFLATATKGNVTAEYAFLQNRMALCCKVCDQRLTSKVLEGTEIDYSIQEFIKIHAHVGGHNDEPKLAPEIIPLTCDFKQVKGYFSPIVSEPGGQYQVYKKSFGPIDANLKNEAKTKELTAHAKLKEAVKEILLQNMPESAITEDIKAQEQTLKNLLKMAEMAKATRQERGVISGVHASTSKKAKPLRIATGRKFR